MSSAENASLWRYREFVSMLADLLTEQLGEPVTDLRSDSHLQDDLGLDSFGLLLLLDALEERGGSTIPLVDVELTVGNLFQLIAASASSDRHDTEGPPGVD